MKNNIKTTLLFLLVLALNACKEEQLRVKYPNSTPIYSNTTVAENTIVYGDSITLNVNVSDAVTPLSTLVIKVVVNDEIITSETVRTKGNSASYEKKYKIPFAAHMPNNAEVEVHLSSINVEGNHKDTVLFNTIATRPVIPTIWFVSTTKTVELPLTDVANYIYSAEGLAFGNSVTFRLATKLDKFKKADWTGLVFGNVNGSIGLINKTGDPITLTDATLVGFNKFSLDLYNFTLLAAGAKLEPATAIDFSTFSTISLKSTNHLEVATTEDWKTAQVYLGKNVEITISGITNLNNTMSPDFFEITADNKAKFLGETGVYTLYYLPSANYVYVEQPEAVYPNVMWLCGVGFGRPSTPYIKTSSWNWNSPQEYSFCRKVATGIFQTTIYVDHEADNNYGTNLWKHQFSAKFYHTRGWGTAGVDDESASRFTLPAMLVAQSDGNIGGAETLSAAPGVYRLTINLNTMVITFVKIN